MERIEGLNPDRLRWCLDDRGLTLAELSDALKIASTTLDQVMSDGVGLTFGQLRKVAAFFNRGVLFFIDPAPVDVDRVQTPQFRTLTNQKPGLSAEVKSLIERAERQRDVLLDLRDDLQESKWPRFRPPNDAGPDPVTAALHIRRWLGLKEDNSFTLTRDACERRGVLVVLAVGYFGEWRLPADSPIAGFSLYDERCPIVLVKKHRTDGRQLFTLAHELGHLVLHRKSFIDEEADLYGRRGREREANLFASHLLVPDSLLEKIDLSQRPEVSEAMGDWLRRWARTWGVSTQMLLLRLSDAGLIPKKVYGAYESWLKTLPHSEGNGGSREYRYREPLHLFGQGYVRTVLDSYHAKRISLNKASGYLDNLKIGDVHRLEAHLASP